LRKIQSLFTFLVGYQKGKKTLDFSQARDSEWQWRQLGHMQVCTSLQTDKHTSTPPLLPSNQQRQSTEGKDSKITLKHVSIERRRTA